MDQLFYEDAICLHIRMQNTPWEEVLHLGERKILKKGTLIPFAETVGFSYIQSGCMRLEQLFPSGDGHIVLYFEEGTLFNEISSIFREKEKQTSSSCFFYAQETSVIYTFQESLLPDRNFIRTYPHLIYNLLQSTAYKSTLILSNSSKNIMLAPEVRISRVLLYLASQSTDKLFFNPGISQLDLAKSLGIPRSSFYRVIAQMRDKGIIGAFTTSKVEILDFEKLQGIAKYSI